MPLLSQAKQPLRRDFSGGNGGLIHLVSGRYGAEIGRILCHDPNRGGGSGGATLSAAAAANRVNFSAEEHRTEQSGDDVRAAHNYLTAAAAEAAEARGDDLAKARPVPSSSRLATKEFPSEKTHFFFPILSSLPLSPSPSAAIEMARGGSLKTEDCGCGGGGGTSALITFCSPLTLSIHPPLSSSETAAAAAAPLKLLQSSDSKGPFLHSLPADAGARTSIRSDAA